MENLVPCKICTKNFNYSPGQDGSARQFCDECRSNVNEAELDRIEKEMIVEGNRYLMDAPKRKSEYDPLDILVDGNMPEFKSDADRFVCALEMAFFLRKQKGGFCGMEERVAEFLEHIGLTHSVLMVRQWTLSMMESAAKNEHLGQFMKKLINVVKDDHSSAYENSKKPQLDRHESGWTCKP